MVRSVNKSRDTTNCIRNEPQYAICVIFTTPFYYKALKLILCDLIWQFICVLTVTTVTGHVTARWQHWAWLETMVTTHENSLIMQSFKGPKLFCDPENLLCFELIWIAILSIIFDWSVHSWSYVFIRLGPFPWVPIAHCAARRGLNLFTVVKSNRPTD